MSSQRRFFRRLSVGAVVLALVGCATPSNVPVPAPLPVVKNAVDPQVVWHNQVAAATEFYRFSPAHLGDLLVVAGSPNELRAMNLSGGQQQWQIKLPQAISGGVGAGNGVIVVGTLKGQLLAYDAQGKALWQAQASSEIISAPAVTEDGVLVRTGDGKLSNFSLLEGKSKWQFARQMPALTLRNYAPPVVAGRVAYVGLPAGHIVALSMLDGRLLWESAVAQSKGATEVERVADVAAAPLVAGPAVCAVAYQGRLTCFDRATGAVGWSHDASSASGLTTDGQRVFLSDEQGQVSAYAFDSGRVLWTQDQLKGRLVSAPAMLGNYIAVGDYQGVIHLLNPVDGHFVAQAPTDGGAIAVAPQYFLGQLIVQSQKGGVFSLGIK